MTYLAVGAIAFGCGYCCGLERFNWIRRLIWGKSAIYVRDWKLARDKQFVDDIHDATLRAWKRR